MPVDNRSRRRKRGFVGITSAVVITGMLAFTGLAFDVGYLQWSRMSLQGAADAAAMGGLRELELGNSSTISTAGHRMLKKQSVKKLILKKSMCGFLGKAAEVFCVFRMALSKVLFMNGKK